MLITHGDVIRCAQNVGQQLPDEQRIALGVTLIRMARQPDSFGAVRQAERMVGDHGRALLAEALRHAEGEAEAPYIELTIGTTHGPDPDRPIPGGRVAARAPGSRVLSSLRAAWAGLRAAEARFSAGIYGDLVAGACFVLVTILLIFAAGVLA